MQHDVADEALRHPSHAQHRLAVHHERTLAQTRGLCRDLGRSRPVDVRKPGGSIGEVKTSDVFALLQREGRPMTRARARAVHRTRALDRRRPGGRAAAAGAGRPVRRRHVHRRSPAVPAGGQHGRPTGRRHRPRRDPCAGGDRRPLRRAAGRGARRPGHRRGAGRRPRPGSRTRSGRLLAAADRSRAELAAIGIGLPGPVEHRTGRAINPPIMPGWDRFDVPSARPPVLRRPGAHRQRRQHHGPGRAAHPVPRRARTWCCSRSRPGSARASSPAACCSAAPRGQPATSGTSGSAAPPRTCAGAATSAASRRWRPAPRSRGRCGSTAPPSGRPAMWRTGCGPAISPRSGPCARRGGTSAGSWP